jgi:outer membrane lipoprotein-sorting protein
MLRLRLFFSLFFFFPVLFSMAQDARDVIKKADDKAKGKSSQAIMTIQIIRPSWTREMSLKTWSKGNDLALILITAPVKDKGIVYLKRKKEVWNWIPTIERNIKLPPSMMGQSWMGTDFTNDDLVKEASIVEDYNHSFLADAAIDGRDCYLVQMIPKPEAAVVWGKVLLWVDKKEFLMLHGEYFDESGKLVNTLHASDVKLLGGRMLPARLEMVPIDKKGNKTILLYRELSFDKPIADEVFSIQYMSKVQ